MAKIVQITITVPIPIDPFEAASAMADVMGKVKAFKGNLPANASIDVREIRKNSVVEEVASEVEQADTAEQPTVELNQPVS